MNSSIPDPLFLYIASGKTLAQAVEAFCRTLPGEGGVGLFYSANECFFARLVQTGESAELTRASGNPVNLAPVYEARVFHPGAELRWWNDPTPRQAHRAVILTQQEWPQAPQFGFQPGTFHRPIIGTIEQKYLLWGNGVEGASGVSAGWGVLADYHQRHPTS